MTLLVMMSAGLPCLHLELNTAPSCVFVLLWLFSVMFAAQLPALLKASLELVHYQTKQDSGIVVMRY